jgi:hypothetical protein
VLLKWGVGNFLYSQESWPALGAALEAARTGSGTRMLSAALQYLEGPLQDPFYAINCGDGPVTTVADIDAYAGALRAARIALPYASLACVGWPVHDLSPSPPLPPGPLPPIVLVASLGDPATPYRWGVAVKNRLGAAATLITSEAFSHTSFAKGDDCIDAPVAAYLLAGTLPAPAIRCPAPAPLLAPFAHAAPAPRFRDPPRLRR